MPSTEGARVQLEVLWMVAQKVKHPVAKTGALCHRLVTYPFVLAAVAPIVLLQDQLQYVAVALGAQWNVVQRGLLAGTRSTARPAFMRRVVGCVRCVFLCLSISSFVFALIVFMEPRYSCVGGFQIPMLGQWFAAVAIAVAARKFLKVIASQHASCAMWRSPQRTRLSWSPRQPQGETPGCGAAAPRTHPHRRLDWLRPFRDGRAMPFTRTVPLRQSAAMHG